MSATEIMPAYYSHYGRLRMLAGERALDLANTTHWRDGKLVDFVPDYKSLVNWSVPAGLLSADEAKQILKLFKVDDANTREIHLQWQHLRAAFRSALDVITKRAGRTLKAENPQSQLAQILLDTDAVTLNTIAQSRADLLALPLTRSLLAVTNLLSFEPKGKIRQCEGDPCGGYFLDQSRAKPRRWCSMDSCGNRAKVKKFRRQGS